MQKLIIGALGLVGDKKEGVGLIRLPKLRLSESFIFKVWREVDLLVFDEKLCPILSLAHWSLWRAPTADILLYGENCAYNLSWGQACTWLS